MLKEHVRARVPKCLSKESRYLLPLRNPSFFDNLSHLLPNKMGERFSHKSVSVNIYPCPLDKKGGESQGMWSQSKQRSVHLLPLARLTSKDCQMKRKRLHKHYTITDHTGNMFFVSDNEFRKMISTTGVSKFKDVCVSVKVTFSAMIANGEKSTQAS